MAKSLAIAVVGGGEAATKAITALMKFPLLELKAVVCAPRELKELIETSLRVATYQNALNRPDVEAVYIATPNSTHVPLAISAIQAGKHVLIEKPLGASLQDASQLLNYKSRGLLIAVAFKKRFGAGIQYLRRLLNVTGLPHNIDVKWRILQPQSNWRFDLKVSGGGVIMDLGSHVFDLLEYLFGGIKEIDAKTHISDKAIDIEDVAYVNLRFQSGCRAFVDLSLSSGILCQQMSLGFSTGELLIERIGHQDFLRLRLPDSASELIFDPKSEYEGLLKEFCDTIWNGNGNVPTLEAGIRNHIILEAAYKSATDGHQVCV